MCTAITYHTRSHYFGRTLDLEYAYDERITITPRNYPLHFRELPDLDHHYAMIGVAFVVDGYPLYYDGVNEKGLGVAGLNFPGNADYKPRQAGKHNVCPYEFIPWLLGQCATVQEARKLLERTSFLNVPFRADLPLAPLHWLIADRDSAITVESMAGGLNIYDNPVGVLTNNPPFDFHMLYLENFINLTRGPATNRFCASLTFQPYCNGMGAMGLPGDLSSPSRFVKAAFTKLNSVCGNSEAESVSQFFHILGSVTQQRGCVQVGEDKYMTTLYTSCCNVDTGVYYYTTYGNSQISGVDMYQENLEGTELVSYPLIRELQIRMQN